MKLYISPGACSLGPHIVAREAGLPIELEAVNLKTKQTRSGKDYWSINPKGQVPALVLADGSVLTEVAAVVQYLADQKPEAKLAPPPGTADHYRLLEWLNFIATELHKGFSPIFHGQIPEEVKQLSRQTLAVRLGYVNTHLTGRPYLLGATFTVADAYLFTILGWSRHGKVDLQPFAALPPYVERMRARPAVRAALDAEKALREVQ